MRKISKHRILHPTVLIHLCAASRADYNCPPAANQKKMAATDVDPSKNAAGDILRRTAIVTNKMDDKPKISGTSMPNHI